MFVITLISATYDWIILMIFSHGLCCAFISSAITYYFIKNKKYDEEIE
jgi:hypothetical protein